MKRWLALAAGLILCLGLAVGCTKTDGETGQEEQSQTEEETQTEGETSEEEESQETQEETGTVPFTAYVSDDQAMYLVEEEMMAQEDTAESVVEALTKAGALPEGSRLLSCKWQNEAAKELAVDMNTAFGEGMQHMGTTGEYLCMGSLVNTLLTYYEADSLVLTVEGETLETGHSIYDSALSFYEQPEE